MASGEAQGSLGELLPLFCFEIQAPTRPSSNWRRVNYQLSDARRQKALGIGIARTSLQVLVRPKQGNCSLLRTGTVLVAIWPLMAASLRQ